MKVNPDHLAPVELTPQGKVISDIFFELSNGRGSGFGPAPLQWSEILAWTKLTGWHLDRWSLTLLQALDGIYLKRMSDLNKQQQQTPGKNKR